MYAHAVQARIALAVVLALTIPSCRTDTTAAATDPGAIEAAPIRPPPASPAPAPPAAPAAEIPDGEPVREGRVVFEGMVVPTKPGHSVRGVVFDGDALPGAVAATAGKPAASEALLGARVRVTATVVRREDPPPRGDGLAEQRREGSWLQAKSVESAAITTPPVVIEGKLLRSKGLFQVGEHLVTRSDIAWALAPDGAQDGDRVRLWGQPRVYRCAPHEQCLIGGTIPMFDVGRAERLP